MLNKSQSSIPCNIGPRRAHNVFLIIGILITFCVKIEAQVGVDTCACQPGEYGFILNFALTCAQMTVPRSGGIAETACIVDTETEQSEIVTDFRPIQASCTYWIVSFLPRCHSHRPKAPTHLLRRFVLT